MSKTIETYGIRFQYPDGWSLRVFAPRQDGDEQWGLNIHGASLALPLDDTSSYASGTMGQLGPLDLGFTMIESLPHAPSGVVPGVGAWAPAKPSGLTPQHFNAARLQATRPGQMGVQRAFTINGRLLEIYVVLGGAAAAHANLGPFNALLTSFEAASSTTATDYRAA